MCEKIESNCKILGVEPIDVTRTLQGPQKEACKRFNNYVSLSKSHPTRVFYFDIEVVNSYLRDFIYHKKELASNPKYFIIHKFYTLVISAVEDIDLPLRKFLDPEGRCCVICYDGGKETKKTLIGCNRCGECICEICYGRVNECPICRISFLEVG